MHTLQEDRPKLCGLLCVRLSGGRHSDSVWDGTVLALTKLVVVQSLNGRQHTWPTDRDYDPYKIQQNR